MEERDRTARPREGKKEREGGIAVLNDGRIGERKEAARQPRRLADFVGVLDKFSAIGSFDADSPSASPPTCVQIEGFRKSCDIPPRKTRKRQRKCQGTRSRQIGEPEGKRERERDSEETER